VYPEPVFHPSSGYLVALYGDERFACSTIFCGGIKHISRPLASPRASFRRALALFCLWAASALLPLTAQVDPQVLLEED
jgi:hypothetical protein